MPRRWRNNNRGLAEIVGTLMLVLIVVAAATAFAFFVSSEEQTTLAEQTALHYKNLENVTIESLSDTPPVGRGLGTLVIVLASSDIYNTNVTGLSVGGDPISTFCQTPVRTGVVPCNNLTMNFQNFSAAGGQGYLNLTPFTVTAVTVLYNSTFGFYLPFTFPTGTVQILMGTERGNEFTESLYPPVAEFGINFVTNFPVLDGSMSYQPHSGTSPTTSINSWVWTIKSLDPHYPDNTTYGQQAQLPYAFVSGDVYQITLNVTNTLGLQGSTEGSYTAP